MYWHKQLVILACLAIFGLPGYANSSSMRHRAYHPHYRIQAWRCPIYRNADGNLITCDGWRLRNTMKGWDHSCIDLFYLPSQFACSSQ
jgi:hypothetical protein